MGLELTLLGIVAIAQLLTAFFNPRDNLSLANGLGLALFSGLRFISPQRFKSKLLYTLAEFILIIGLGLGGNVPLFALLFVVLVIRNCVLLEGWSQVAVTGLAFGSCLALQTYRMMHQNLLVRVPLDQLGAVWMGFFLFFGLVILFLHLLVDAALKECQGQEQLALANARLRQYALRIEDLAAAQERNRIARDIHDALGHSLTVFGIHLEAALRLLPTQPAQAEELLLEIKHLNSKTLQEVRQSVTALRTNPLRARSLAESITDLTAEFQRSTGIVPTVTVQLTHILATELQVAIYRIVQESLTNICKYAAATTVVVDIQQNATHLDVTIQDNGKGFDLHQNTTGFGLQGMQERTLALAGQLKIKTASAQGCCITARFPLS
jgi:signal transduction histidine kinase